MFFDINGNITVNNIIQYPDKNYDELKNKALNCKRCHLREKCNQVVMGEGSTENHIMLIGEGPGADEDRIGTPFVGRAGQLLDKILKAVGIDRDDIYISNIVKCRPPGNRKPTENEVLACAPILISEIKLIDPKVIVPLGSTALKTLINKNASITRMRGEWIQRGKYFFLPTFHPAYLLRNSNMKEHVWYDFKKIKKALERIKELKNNNNL